jgi:hypothetical protein
MKNIIGKFVYEVAVIDAQINEPPIKIEVLDPNVFDTYIPIGKNNVEITTIIGNIE